MKAIGKIHEATPAQVALAWLLAKPQVTSILIGASKMNQLEDNLGAVDFELSLGEVAELDQMTMPPPTYPNWFNANVFDVPVRDALTGAAQEKLSR